MEPIIVIAIVGVVLGALNLLLCSLSPWLCKRIRKRRDPNRIKYRKGLEALKQEHFEKCLDGTSPKPKRGWKRDWKWLVQYDHDWDYRYLLEIVLFKLKRMRLWFDCFAIADRKEHVDPEIASMDAAIAIGDRLLGDQYGEEDYRFMLAHSSVQIVINRASDHTELDVIDCPREQDGFVWFSARKLVQKWCDEHGVDRKTVYYGTRGKWDSEENYHTWIQMGEREQEAITNDYKEFFRIIGEHIREWWD